MFYHIVLNDVFNNVYSLRNEIKHLLFALVVAASCLLFSDKIEWNTSWCWLDGVVELIPDFGNALKWSNEIPYIDTDTFQTYYYDCIWREKLANTLSA